MILSSTPLVPHSWGKNEESGDTPDPGSILLHRHVSLGQLLGEEWEIGGHPQTRGRDESLHSLQISDLGFSTLRDTLKRSAGGLSCP
jgi:hypothetical protein